MFKNNFSFLYKNYDSFLKLSKKNNYKFLKFEELNKKALDNKKEKKILLRHDIDFSIKNAFQIAKIEKNNNIKSTFFVQLFSNFYQLNQKENIQVTANTLLVFLI